jgi:hypothetical protein
MTGGGRTKALLKGIERGQRWQELMQGKSPILDSDAPQLSWAHLLRVISSSSDMITVIVDQKELAISIHKSVVAIHSVYSENLFQHTNENKPHPLPHADHISFGDFVVYLYSGTVVSVEDLKALGSF